MSERSYTVFFEYFRDEDAEGYHVVVPAMPEVITWGRTMAVAEANAREALECHIQGLLKDGDALPDDSLGAPISRLALPQEYI